MIYTRNKQKTLKCYMAMHVQYYYLNIVLSQHCVLRFGNRCTNLDTFTLNLNKLFQKLSNRGHEHSNLMHIIKRCLRKNNIVFRKYSISDDNMIFSQLT